MDALLGSLIVQLLLAQVQLQRLAAQTAYAAEIHQPLFAVDQDGAIRYWADTYNVPFYEIRETIKCESGFDPLAVGKLGETGLAQIYLKYHTDVTRAQARDPDFSVQFIAKNWKDHKEWWSCARIKGFL